LLWILFEDLLRGIEGNLWGFIVELILTAFVSFRVSNFSGKILYGCFSSLAYKGLQILIKDFVTIAFYFPAAPEMSGGNFFFLFLFLSYNCFTDNICDFLPFFFFWCTVISPVIRERAAS